MFGARFDGSGVAAVLGVSSEGIEILSGHFCCRNGRKTNVFDFSQII